MDISTVLNEKWFMQLYTNMNNRISKTKIFNYTDKDLMDKRIINNGDRTFTYKLFNDNIFIKDIKTKCTKRFNVVEETKNFDFSICQHVFNEYIEYCIAQIDWKVFRDLIKFADNSEIALLPISVNDLDACLNKIDLGKCSKGVAIFVSEFMHNVFFKDEQFFKKYSVVGNKSFYDNIEYIVVEDRFLEIVYEDKDGNFSRRISDLLVVPINAFMRINLIYSPMTTVDETNTFYTSLAADYDFLYLDKAFKPYSTVRLIDLPLKRCVICDDPIAYQCRTFFNKHYTCSTLCLDKYDISSYKHDNLRKNKLVLDGVNKYRKLLNLKLLDVWDFAERMDTKK